MIIRTNMAQRAATREKVVAPSLSNRELRRLANTKHAKEKKYSADPVSIAEEKPVEEEIKVREENNWVKVEETISEKTVEAPEETIAKPGTAIVRSKVLEEIANKYQAEPQEKPKKKYKVISIGEKK